MSGCVAQSADEASAEDAVGMAASAVRESIGACAAACTEQGTATPPGGQSDTCNCNCNCPAPHPQPPPPAGQAAPPPPPQGTRPPPVAYPPATGALPGLGFAPPVGCAPPIALAPPLVGFAPPLVGCAPPITGCCCRPELGLPGGFLYVGQFGNYLGIPLHPSVGGCF